MGKILEQESNPQDCWLEKCLEIFPKRDEGESLEGVVVQMDKDFAYLDVGMKSEGCVPLLEFNETPKIGDVVFCVLVRQEGKNGTVVVSKRQADLKIMIKNLIEAFNSKSSVEGKFSKIIKGGFEVSIGSELSAFLPISRADITRVEEPKKYIGLVSQFYLERVYERGKISLVVDRRSYLESTLETEKAKFFTSVEVGDVVEGVVKGFASFGVFVDLGGFDGLLHLNDMSWGRVTSPREYVAKDQKVALKVVRVDRESRKVNLGLKHFQEDPWISFEQRYHVGDIVEGKVTKIADFGVFVEIEEGLEGLVHISELSWVEHVKHPKEILSVEDHVRVCILACNTDERRISLGLKQTVENPWTNITEKYPVGIRVSGEVKKVTPIGAFISLEKDINGFLHVNDSSWGKRVRNFASTYKVGSRVDTVIISVCPSRRRINLGVKQLLLNPWDEMVALQKRREPVEVEVTGKTDFGVFVKVPNGLEGLVHKSHLIDDGGMCLLEKVEIGDKFTTVIISVLPKKHRLSLSVRNYVRSKQEKELGEYLSHDSVKDSSYTLAEALEKKV